MDKSDLAETQSSSKLSARIEALLYVSPTPVEISQLANVLQVSIRNVENALHELADFCVARGIRVQSNNREVQLTTAPEFAGDVERFFSLEGTGRLSRAALEVLAIIAYQQPVTRPQIDSIRGVNSDSVLRNLLRHGLIQEVGRSHGPGRPFLYSTTSEFLQHFGLASLKELPPLDTSAGSEDQDIHEGVSEGDLD